MTFLATIRAASARGEQCPVRRDVQPCVQWHTVFPSLSLLPRLSDQVRGDVLYGGSAALSADATSLAAVHTAAAATRILASPLTAP